MERWRGKVALVTGASQGMGEAIAAELVSHGMIVFGCARNIKGLQALKEKVQGKPGKFFPVQCDLQDERSILAMFHLIDTTHGGLHVLINNAGVVKNSTLLDAPTEDWREMLNVMVLAPCITAREAIKSMKKHKIDDGHVIHISSIGPYAFPPMPFLHFPCATKYALNALTKGLRHELLCEGSGIRISAISPGMTDTGTFEHVTTENTADKQGVLEGIKALKVSDIAAAVVFALSAPPHCDVFDILMHPTGGF